MEFHFSQPLKFGLEFHLENSLWINLNGLELQQPLNHPERVGIITAWKYPVVIVYSQSLTDSEIEIHRLCQGHDELLFCHKYPLTPGSNQGLFFCTGFFDAQNFFSKNQKKDF
jgi:hypothetical protein